MHGSSSRFSDNRFESPEIKMAKRIIRNRQTMRDKVLKKMRDKGKSLRDLFNEIDDDGSGEIEPDELFRALDKMKLSVLYKDGEDLLRAIDTDGNGTIDFEEFSTWLTSDHSAVQLRNMEQEFVEREKRLAEEREFVLNRAAAKAKKGGFSSYGASGSEQKYTNGAAATQGRRTSYALGTTVRIQNTEAASKARFFENRDKVRKNIIARMGGADGSDIRLHRVFRSMQNQDGEVTFLSFKRFMDRNGMAVMHQDGKDLMAVIDTDGNGLIDLDELKQFLYADHAQIQAQMEKRVGIEREMSSAVSHYDWSSSNSYRKSDMDQQKQAKSKGLTSSQQISRHFAGNKVRRSLHSPKSRRRKYSPQDAVSTSFKADFFDLRRLLPPPPHIVLASPPFSSSSEHFPLTNCNRRTDHRLTLQSSQSEPAVFFSHVHAERRKRLHPTACPSCMSELGTYGY